MLKLRFVVLGVAALVAVLLTVGTLSGPASAFGPGGWDHVGDGGTQGSDSLNGKVAALNDEARASCWSAATSPTPAESLKPTASRSGTARAGPP